MIMGKNNLTDKIMGKKVNFSDIKGMLSKDQMKTIKGGSTPQSCGTSYKNPQTYQLGYCTTTNGYVGGQPATICVCFAGGVLEQTQDCYFH